jgi:hypothetical protein
MKLHEMKLVAESMVLAAALTLAAHAQTTVYDNSAPANYKGQSVGLANLPAGIVEFGDEITLAGTDRALTALKVEVFGKDLSGDETATIHLYSISGSLSSGFTLTEIGSGGPAPIVNGFNTLTYTEPGLTLPDKLVWTISFAGVSSSERAELPIYNPPTVGSSAEDFWTKDSAGDFALFRFPGSNPVGNFAANVTAVPEAGTVVYGLMGGLMILGYFRLRRGK